MQAKKCKIFTFLFFSAHLPVFPRPVFHFPLANRVFFPAPASHFSPIRFSHPLRPVLRFPVLLFCLAMPPAALADPLAPIRPRPLSRRAGREEACRRKTGRPPPGWPPEWKRRWDACAMGGGTRPRGQSGGRSARRLGGWNMNASARQSGGG